MVERAARTRRGRAGPRRGARSPAGVRARARACARDDEPRELVRDPLHRDLATTGSAPGIARRVPAARSYPSCAANRTARIGRSPSSANRSSATPTARTSRRCHVGAAAVRDRGTRRASGSQASAFIVKSRRARSASRSRWNVTDSGRRPSTYVPSPRKVVTSMARPPESDRDGAVLDAGRDHLREERRHLARRRRGRDVEVARLARSVEQEVADRAADDPGAVAGVVRGAARTSTSGRRERARARARAAGTRIGRPSVNRRGAPPRRDRGAGSRAG